MFNLIYNFNKLRDNFFYTEFNFQLKKGKIFPPFMVAWDCSRKCNLHCAHCGAVKEKYDKELSTEQIKALIDQLAVMKVPFFGATGGEPLLRKDLINVLRYAVKKRIKTGFATNGYFLDKETAKKIKDAGISSIQISLDGTEGIHNKIRGNNLSFKRAVEAIKNLQSENIKIVSVATTVTPMNFENLKELKNLLLELKVKRWRLCIIMPIGRADKNNLSLRPEQIRSLLKFIASNKENITIQVGENLPFLAEYEKKIRKAPLVCPVGFTACCIGVDGNVRGCPEMPDRKEFIEGNILTKPFSEIWKNGFKKYRNREILLSDKKCFACKDTHCIYDLLGEY